MGTNINRGELPSKVVPDDLRRVVTRRSNHRAGRVTTGPAKIQSVNRAAIRYSVGEANLVVHVVDVPAADAKVTFDFRRRQYERLAHQLAAAPREAGANRKQVAHVAVLLPFPARGFRRVGNPLAEQLPAVPAFLILHLRILPG